MKSNEVGDPNWDFVLHLAKCNMTRKNRTSNAKERGPEMETGLFYGDAEGLGLRIFLPLVSRQGRTGQNMETVTPHEPEVACSFRIPKWATTGGRSTESLLNGNDPSPIL